MMSTADSLEDSHQLERRGSVAVGSAVRHPRRLNAVASIRDLPRRGSTLYFVYLVLVLAHALGNGAE